MVRRKSVQRARAVATGSEFLSGDLCDEDLIERIDRELQEILLNHQPEALAQETIREMRSITEKFRQGYVASS